MNKYDELNNIELILALKELLTTWGPTMSDDEYTKELMEITMTIFSRMDKERRYK